MRSIIFLLSVISISCYAGNENKLYELQLEMVGESLNSENSICFNYGNTYLKKQKELAALVTNSNLNDSEYILEAAVMANSLYYVKRFVEAGASFITHQYSWGASLLHIAAVHSTPEVIKYLYSKGLDVNIEINDRGVTPLHLAVESNKIKNIEALIKLGADVNIKDDQGAVPIIYTFVCKDTATFKFLLDKGTIIYPNVIEIAKIIGASIES